MNQLTRRSDKVAILASGLILFYKLANLQDCYWTLPAALVTLTIDLLDHKAQKAHVSKVGERFGVKISPFSCTASLNLQRSFAQESCIMVDQILTFNINQT